MSREAQLRQGATTRTLFALGCGDALLDVMEALQPRSFVGISENRAWQPDGLFRPIVSRQSRQSSLWFVISTILRPKYSFESERFIGSSAKPAPNVTGHHKRERYTTRRLIPETSVGSVPGPESHVDPCKSVINLPLLFVLH